MLFSPRWNFENEPPVVWTPWRLLPTRKTHISSHDIIVSSSRPRALTSLPVVDLAQHSIFHGNASWLLQAKGLLVLHFSTASWICSGCFTADAVLQVSDGSSTTLYNLFCDVCEHCDEGVKHSAALVHAATIYPQSCQGCLGPRTCGGRGKSRDPQFVHISLCCTGCVL